MKRMSHINPQGLEPLMMNSVSYYEMSKISDRPTTPNNTEVLTAVQICKKLGYFFRPVFH